ncbi:MAG: hypothetical protein AVDCRST_MAG18-658 [uncultured Thermomicrobiales bacterium]|uniref:Uncharacterized protein n=1 Tax=uncultured Thermomicrobiales bacterium TaxID=1645740 RepID=A0A6J4UNA8_9BACT|nr:MAG: hypothetical protein AVDCRST_MAG18-658 [uncultured Thermomicrobiales bacterium]
MTLPGRRSKVESQSAVSGLIDPMPADLRSSIRGIPQIMAQEQLGEKGRRAR